MSCLCTTCRAPAGDLVTIPFGLPVPDGENPRVTITITSTTDHRANKATRSLPVRYPRSVLRERLARAKIGGCPAHAIRNLEAVLRAPQKEPN